MPSPAVVSRVRVDDEGVTARSDEEVVLDVLFDGRRIWSFWLWRDGQARGGDRFVPWPAALRRHLDGSTRLSLVVHVDQRPVYDEEVRLGSGEGRVAVVNDRGQPLGIDKSLRLVQTFETRSAEHVEPLLDAVEEVIDALGKAGVEAFPAYGTLLGAVRDGRLIGHDSDADIGYVSEHTHPVDVMLESFGLQRALADMGYQVSRYSGIAFKVDVEEADGSIRGLDVFGGFLADGCLYLMGEIRTPFRREWVFPLGTTTLEGRTLPAPRDTDRFLVATYGRSWRVPDPAFHFETPPSTYRRLNGWFRGIRIRRSEWDRIYSGEAVRALPDDAAPSPFARWVRRRERGVPGRVVDVGCGRGVDALWFARMGSEVVGLDYVPRGASAAAQAAREEGLDAEFRAVNLLELRSVLSEGARVSRLPGPTTVTVRHVAEATDRVGRQQLWRGCEMMLRGGGRLYLEHLVRRSGPPDPFARRNQLGVLPREMAAAELKARGARVLHSSVRSEPGEPGRARRIGRMVVTWES